MSEDRYVFIAEWFDTTADLVRKYNFTYYTKDDAIQMFDIKNRRIFLKKTEYPAIQLKDLFIGATVSVYSRQLKIVDFADQFTRLQCEKQKGKSLLLIKPDAYEHTGKIINIVEQEGFTIGNIKVVKMSKQECQKFLIEQRGKQHYNNLVEHLSSDLVTAIELVADDCISRAKNMTDSIVATYGKSGVQNAVYTSQSSTSAIKDLQFFFSSKSILKCPAQCTSCSCLVIKPHIVSDGYVGQILDLVLNSGFEISAMEMFWLDKPSAEQFLQVYKTIVPEYSQLVDQLTNGPCIAVEARQNNAVNALRQICGPHDPEMARTLRPKSIRAMYGKDKQKNAVHCTDLVQDALIQVEYFFNILQK